MKNVILILLLGFTTQCFSQTLQHPPDSITITNLFYAALKIHLGYTIERLGKNDPNKIWDVIVQVPERFFGKLPNKIDNFNVKYYVYEKPKISKGKSIYVIKMENLALEDNFISVGVGDFTLSRLRWKRKNLEYKWGNSGGTTVSFTRNDYQSNFIISNVNHGNL